VVETPPEPSEADWLDKVLQMLDIAADFILGLGELNEMGCRYSSQET
jgi:hypothetical protein